jgi:uncharacterized protein (DUF58 family)
MVDETLLLEEPIRRKLDRLMLSANKVRPGAIKGDRRSTKRGTSIEFADYRDYTPGDDLRRLDWNIYARTDRPYIKLLEDEEDLAVHILLDSSASMDWPGEQTEGYSMPEETNKLLFGKKLAAGLAYISLGSNDRLTITSISQGKSENFGPTRGRGYGVEMLRFMKKIEAGGVTDLNQMLRDYALRARRPGLCFIISDMFSPGGYMDGLNILLGKGYEIALIHLLSPDEVTPPQVGDLRLVDVETGVYQEVSMDGSMRELYSRRLQAWRDQINGECRGRGVNYIPVVTDTSWESIILYNMRRLGLVK